MKSKQRQLLAIAPQMIVGKTVDYVYEDNGTDYLVFTDGTKLEATSYMGSGFFHYHDLDGKEWG